MRTSNHSEGRADVRGEVTMTTNIDAELKRWRSKLRRFHGTGGLSEQQEFLLSLGQAYDQARDDYAELALLAEQVERQRDEARAELDSLRSRLRGLGGAA